jgi:hypothetical protein
MQGMGTARGTKFLKSQLLRRLLPILGRRIILPFTFVASKAYEFPHGGNLPVWSY